MAIDLTQKWCKHGEHFASTTFFYSQGRVFSPSCKSCTCKRHKENYIYKRKPKLDGLKFCHYGDHYVPLDGFTKSAKEKDGLESRCRECRHKAHREKNPPAPHALASEGMKWCNSRQHYQPHSMFAICKTSRDGRKWHCRDCINQKGKGKNAARRALLGPVRPWNKAPDVMRSCARCGTEFRIKPHRAESQRFCSHACTKDRVTIQCENCSKAFDVRRYRVKNVKYCSRACAAQWQGRRTYSGKDGFKKCSGCAEIKPHLGFHKASRNPDGLMDRCKSCHKVQQHKRRAQIKAAAGSFTRNQFREKWTYWGQRCFYCWRDITENEATIEHRQPVSRGGSNWIANIVAACYDCNAQKNNKTEGEYRSWLKVRQGRDWSCSQGTASVDSANHENLTCQHPAVDCARLSLLSCRTATTSRGHNRKHSGES